MTKYLQERTIFAPQIHKRVSKNLGIIVVIPAYDEPFLLLSLMALHRCEMPLCDVEIIVVVNDSEKDTEAIRKKNFEIYQQAEKWAATVNRARRWFHILYHDKLPKKQGGVGLARKIGMDEAVFRFEKAKKPRGIIACFDADSRCDKNYLVELYQHFKQKPRTQACSIYFEHPLYGIDYEDEVYEAIILYELHLRYYINAQRFANFPFAYQTIGSSMAVRSDAYQKQGGMNRRKAGEDFYFIHKFTPLGYFSELNTTRVIPSPRPSHRVPFGTGKAVDELLKTKQSYLTYAPQSFIDLKQLFKMLSLFYKKNITDIPQDLKGLSTGLQAFLEDYNFIDHLTEIKKNTANRSTFSKRFYRWFDAFMLMKYVHFMRDEYYPNVPIEEAATWFLRIGSSFKKEDLEGNTAKDLLMKFRQWDRAS